MLRCQKIMFTRTGEWRMFNPFEHLTRSFSLTQKHVEYLKKNHPREMRLAEANPGCWISGNEEYEP
ncbi:hypothetical protein [Pelotomaculum propionicicum]|uniref:Uncharacterized protein n=1 Tax=Pelotomaculum propionicicum TaxID=258475 RepID=A0A4Y7RWW2_9FIRM|nr:hypothetical protein [Pelotomaculum propionicicum]TEB13343.1 hypothetical protein Pmgp_00237 [Pelotomaculum propionicicum]